MPERAAVPGVCQGRDGSAAAPPLALTAPLHTAALSVFIPNIKKCDSAVREPSDRTEGGREGGRGALPGLSHGEARFTPMEAFLGHGASFHSD